MSNLSDLLPAGAGGKQVDFVASGTLSSGQTVGLKTDGTVEAISATAAVVGAGTQLLPSNFGDYPALSSVSGSQAVAAVNNGTGIDCYVLTGSGTTITRSTSSYSPSVNGLYAYSLASCYDSANNKIVLFWMEFTNPTRAEYVRVGTVSGTGASASISWGTVVNIANPTTYTGYQGIVYDPDTGNFIISYYNNTTYQTAICGTVSGTTVNMGTPVVIYSGASFETSLDYDAGAQRMVFAYETPSPFTLVSKVGQMTGANSSASITLGAEQLIYTGNISYPITVVYDPDNAKTCVIYLVGTSLNVVVGTVTGGGTNTVSWGTAVAVQANVFGGTVDAAYDTNLDRLVVVWREAASPYYSYMQGVTITGTTPSAGPTTVVMPYSSNQKSLSFNSTLQKTFYAGSGNADMTSLLIAPLSTNNASFIGITDAAISSAASGSVTIKGGISSNVSSLTPNATYYVQTDGTLTTTSSTVLAGRALSSTSINLDYTT